MKKIICLIVTLILLVPAAVFAADTYGGYNVPVDIELNGHFIKCAEQPILIDGITYIPLRAFSDAVGGSIFWDDSQRAAVLEQGGHSFRFYPDDGSCVIDGEKADYDSVLYQNLTFIPVRVISETLGYDVVWDDFYLAVKITAPHIQIPEEFRAYPYTYEDMLYLGKITQIESGYEPFAVKLGVACTVVNSVKSSKFPNTVKGVIFDTKYGTQFPPVHTSKIEVIPAKDTMIAAKCALRGVQVVGNSLYFIDTSVSSKSWAHNNRPFYCTLHEMNFYE